MSTEQPNPFASPASQPAPSVFNQFNASGLNMTPGQTGIANFRARGGVPIGGSQKQAAPMAPPQGGQLGGATSMPAQGSWSGNPALGGATSMPAQGSWSGGQLGAAQGMQAQQGMAGQLNRMGGVQGNPRAQLGGMYGGPPSAGPVAMPAQPGQMAGRIRPPSNQLLRPRTSPVAQPVTSAF